MDNVVNIKDFKRKPKKLLMPTTNIENGEIPLYDSEYEVSEVSAVDIESSIKTLEIMIVDFMYSTGLDDIELVVEFIKKIKEKNFIWK